MAGSVQFISGSSTSADSSVQTKSEPQTGKDGGDSAVQIFNGLT